MVTVEFTDDEARLTQAAQARLTTHLRGEDWHILIEALSKVSAARAEPEKPKRGRPRKQAE